MLGNMGVCRCDKWHGWLTTDGQVSCHGFGLGSIQNVCLPSLNVCCDTGGRQEGVDTAEINLSLMVPGAWVLVRYGTTQRESQDGVTWRKVKVLRQGHVSETSYGRHTNMNGDGWWVTQPPFGVEKFFLKFRFLEVKSC